MKTSRRKNTAGSVLVNLAGRSLLAVAAFVLLGAETPQAEGVVTDRDWINIDHINNGNDTENPYGDVGYEYRISSIETTVNDWDAFYGDGGGTGSGIGGGTAVGSFSSIYDRWTDGSVGGVSLDKDSPVAEVSMYQAAQYANWLTTGDATDGRIRLMAAGM